MPFIGVLTLLVLYCSSCQIQLSPVWLIPQSVITLYFRLNFAALRMSRAVLMRRISNHWRVMGATTQEYCYGYRRIDALKLQGHSHIIFHKIVEVELVGVEPTCRDDFLYESTSQRTNAKIIESNKICKRKGDYFCSPVGL